MSIMPLKAMRKLKLRVENTEIRTQNKCIVTGCIINGHAENHINNLHFYDLVVPPFFEIAVVCFIYILVRG